MPSWISLESWWLSGILAVNSGVLRKRSMSSGSDRSTDVLSLSVRSEMSSLTEDAAITAGHPPHLKLGSRNADFFLFSTVRCVPPFGLWVQRFSAEDSGFAWALRTVDPGESWPEFLGVSAALTPAPEALAGVEMLAPRPGRPEALRVRGTDNAALGCKWVKIFMQNLSRICNTCAAVEAERYLVHWYSTYKFSALSHAAWDKKCPALGNHSLPSTLTRHPRLPTTGLFRVTILTYVDRGVDVDVVVPAKCVLSVGRAVVRD